MARETQMNRAGSRRSSPARAVRANTRFLASDALELAELQVRLFAADGQRCAHRSIFPLLTIGVGLTMLLSAFSFTLLGLMHALTAYAKLETWAAALCSGAAGIALGGILVALGYLWLRPQLRLLGQAFVELHDNLEWLKTALRRDDSTSEHREETNHHEERFNTRRDE